MPPGSCGQIVFPGAESNVLVGSFLPISAAPEATTEAPATTADAATEAPATTADAATEAPATTAAATTAAPTTKTSKTKFITKKRKSAPSMWLLFGLLDY